MKLIIQIPCLNEEKTLPLVLADMPKHIEGIDVIELQIIDDGCTDRTVEVAKSLGVNHVVSYGGNRGLGNAFKAGADNALELGADIVVNTDGDNQYPSSSISELVRPILNREAELVIGDRQTSTISHFSWLKRRLQKFGTWVTKQLSGVELQDAVSGFRAYSKEALLSINVTSDFSYVLDTTLQAAKKHLRIVHIPITTNAPTRPSRLFKGMWTHIRKSAVNLLRVYTMYHPLRIFSGAAVCFFLVGVYPIGRFMYFWWLGDGAGHVQSLLFGTMFVIIGVQLFGLGIIGDLMGKQRRLTEDLLYRMKKRE